VSHNGEASGTLFYIISTGCLVAAASLEIVGPAHYYFRTAKREQERKIVLKKSLH
jgi:hypothetical protein